MKLFSRYNRINILTTAAIFLLAGVAFYFLLRFILTKQVDEDLEIEQHEIEVYLDKYGRLPDAVFMKDQQVSYSIISKETRRPILLRTISASKGHHDDQRELIFPIEVKDQWVEVKVTKSLEGTRELTKSVVLITLATILAMLIATLAINRVLLRSLWEPFYRSLTVMKDFRLGNSIDIKFPDTTIEEFANLNNTLSLSVENASREYQRLKDFTENASHELQTPLAIIRSKLEVLIQDEALSEQQSVLVHDVFAAVQRIAKLNQTLLLLSKIENHQYNETTAVELDVLVERKLREFSELILGRQLLVEKILQPVQVNMNAELAEIMLNNLVSNAIRHTAVEGKIIISLSHQSLTISNTAEGSALDESRLYNRFYKGVQSSAHNGLGLSIVSQIAQASGFKIRYNFLGGEHQFSILF